MPRLNGLTFYIDVLQQRCGDFRVVSPTGAWDSKTGFKSTKDCIRTRPVGTPAYNTDFFTAIAAVQERVHERRLPDRKLDRKAGKRRPSLGDILVEPQKQEAGKLSAPEGSPAIHSRWWESDGLRRIDRVLVSPALRNLSTGARRARAFSGHSARCRP
jgi:hypothetical protein